MSLKKGLTYLLGGKLISILISIISGIFLARLIDVEQFGLIGIITIFSGFLMTFKDFGFSTSLIQYKKVNKKLYSTVFWANYIISIIIFSSYSAAAKFISNYFQEPELESIIYITAINFLITPLASISNVLLTRDLKFDIIIKINTTVAIFTSGLAILLAYYDFQLWSLVIQGLVLNLCTTLIIFFKVAWYPSLTFSTKEIKKISRFGSFLTIENIFSYWARNLDNFLIGKFFGANDLALYNRSYQLMLLPLNNITSSFSTILFPAFSKIQNDNRQISAIYLKAIRLITVITFPLMFGLWALSDVFIITVYGLKWAQAAPVLSWLALLGAIQSILSLNGSIYKAKARADLAFKVGLIFNFNIFLGIGIGIYLGSIEYVAIGYFFAVLINMIPNYYIVSKLIDLKIKDLLSTIKEVLVASIIMGIIIIISKKHLIEYTQSQSLTFIIGTIAGICIYCTVLFLLNPPVIKEFMNIIKTKKAL